MNSVRLLLANLGEWALWAQAAAAPAAKKPQPKQELLPWWLPGIMLAILAYMLFMKPDRRERAQMQKLLQNLKQNDRVWTIGGIYGTVVNVSKESDSIVIRVDDTTNTRLRILRSAVARVETDEKKDGEKKDAK